MMLNSYEVTCHYKRLPAFTVRVNAVSAHQAKTIAVLDATANGWPNNPVKFEIQPGLGLDHENEATVE